MKRALAAILSVIACAVFAQSNPDPKQQARPAEQQKPAPEKPQQTPPPKATPQPTTATNEQRPLKELPYTASLDIPSMDRTADPCTDFYQFACGGWIARHPAPPDQPRYGRFEELQERNNAILKDILEAAAKAP